MLNLKKKKSFVELSRLHNLIFFYNHEVYLLNNFRAVGFLTF